MKTASQFLKYSFILLLALSGYDAGAQVKTKQKATPEIIARAKKITQEIKDKSIKRRKDYGNQTTALYYPEDPGSYSIYGPANVAAESQHTYTLEPMAGVGYYWYVDCGVIVDYYDDMTTIYFTSACSFATIYVYDESYNLLAIKDVYITPASNPLSEGVIQTGSQTIPYGETPASLTATAASGGNCSGVYRYQWQVSQNNSPFTDIDLETDPSLSLDYTFTTTTYFRRKVVCGTDSLYTASVAVYVLPPFIGGTITSGNQVINPQTAPAPFTAAAATGCSGSVSYQWQLSKDGYTYTAISGAAGQQLTYSTPLDSTTYFRRRATCGGSYQFTNVVVVRVKEPEVVITPPKNSLDTLLEEAGLDIGAILAIPSDSVANERISQNNEWTDMEEQAKSNLLLNRLSGNPIDDVDRSIIDTTSASDNTVQRLAEADGYGPDSTLIISPFISDSLIQQYRSVGNLAGLDSLTNIAPGVTLEELEANLQEAGNTPAATINALAYVRTDTASKEVILYSSYPGSAVPCNQLDEFESTVWTSGGSLIAGRSLIQFDLTKLPKGAQIRKATLSLYAHLQPKNGNLVDAQYGNNASYLQRVTPDWLCGTSWNGQPTTTTTNQVLLPTSTSTRQNYTGIDVTQLIKDQQTYGNYGLQLRQANETNPYHCMIFYGPRASDSTKRPLLQIEFTITDVSKTIAVAAKQGVIKEGLPPDIFDGMPRPHRAVVNGLTVVKKGNTDHYTAKWFTPLTSAANIKWSVVGGIIVAQNSNPVNGEIYADVYWTSSVGNTQVSVVDLASKQQGSLVVHFINSSPCRVFPEVQTFYWNQTPSILTATGCGESTPYTIKYQWQVMDVYANGPWVDVAGTSGNSANYQPPAIDKAWVMYRRITKLYNGAVLMGSRPSAAVSVKLRVLDPGIISTAATKLPYNSTLSIAASSATGSYMGSTYTVSYSWEISSNGGAWQALSSTEAFPAYNITANRLKIRRKVQVTGLPAYIPDNFKIAYSNELSLISFYKTTDYENRNYIREQVMLTRGVSTWENADQVAIEKKIQTTTYLDGLSRPIQTVGKGTHYDEQTGQWYDMVQSITYEAGGRVDKSLLPYPSTENSGKFKVNVETDQPAYYTSKFGDAKAYATVEYDGSPLNKVKKALAPGMSWVGSGVNVTGDVEPYKATENVRYWTIGYGTTDLPVSTQAYPDNFLVKQWGQDEKGKKLITYTDRSGQVVLKKVQLADGAALTSQHSGWLCTYYVYDDFGQLRYTITPKAVTYLDSHNWAMTTAVADGLCFKYEYDAEGRAIAKKTPDKATELFVYDKRNRVVYTQDGNQRTRNEWHVSFYDARNRGTETGLLTTAKTPDQLQAELNALTEYSIRTVSGGTEQFGANLVVSSRNTSINTYVASQSIELVTGFESPTGDAFVAEIDPGATGPRPPRVYYTYINPAPPVEVTNTATYTALTYTYYDGYGYASAKTFTSDLQLAYKEGDVEPYALSKRTQGMATGAKVRVLKQGSVQFLTTSVFYDEEGRAIQGQEENLSGGVDLTATQYHFDGRVLSSLELHNNPGTPYTNFPTLTKYGFDKVGRVKAIYKKINITTRSYTASTSVPGTQEDSDAGYKQLSSYTYNELGRRTKKVLAPQFNNGQGLETIDYDYNIRGWLTGINKAYALSSSAASQWDHYFGLYIGYDNRDGNFAAAQLNGQITGVQWKSQGDNIQRKYDYEYDAANRLAKATFKQFDNGAWSNSYMNFSVQGLDADNNYQIKYDENGNILNMQAMGYKVGQATSSAVDRLRYQYTTNSNRLRSVTDEVSDPNTKLGDFKDGTNTAGTDDYSFDANGNIVTDLNRGVTTGTTAPAIVYNYLNRPEKITISGKGTIEYLYDASGAKLQKTVTETALNKVTTTTYLGAFIYESVTLNGSAGATGLQSILHEEGRIRVITPYSNANDPANVIGGGITLPDDKQGVFDYFIKDHLSNVRAIITEEINKASSVLTMEDADATRKQYEESLFGNPGATNEVATTRWLKPDAWTTNTSAKVSKLQSPDGTATKVGPNVLLKVMAGDQISARAEYYYATNPSEGTNSTGLTALVQSLINALSGGKATEAVKAGIGGISTDLNANVPLQTLYNTQPTTGNTSAPKAYLNYIFFDEQMKYVGTNSGFKRVSQAGDGAPALQVTDIRAPKNGYVYVYLSNASSEAVYFDNFAVSHQKSALIQEDHYYPYGLRIQAISSKAVASTLNPKAINYGYQGAFSEEVNDFDLGYNEFMLRTYDPQIGRWNEADPFDEFASPYVGMGNDPVSQTDPTGGFLAGGLMAGASTFGRAAGLTVAGMAIGTAIDFIAGGDGTTGAAIGASLGLGAGLASGTMTLATALTTGVASFAVGGALLQSGPVQLQTSMLASNSFQLAMLSNPGNEYATPDGGKITLPDGAEALEFFGPEGLCYFITPKGYDRSRPMRVKPGSLSKFKIAGKTFTGVYSEQTGKFGHYVSEDGEIIGYENKKLVVNEVRVIPPSAPDAKVAGMLAFMNTPGPAQAKALAAATAATAVMIASTIAIKTMVYDFQMEPPYIPNNGGFLYSKGGQRNIWPDDYGFPPNTKDVNWNRSDSQLADSLSNVYEDARRGPGTPNSRAKKWFRDKRPSKNKK